MRRTVLDAFAYLAIVCMAVWFTGQIVYTAADHRPIVNDVRGSVAIENALILASLAAGMAAMLGLADVVTGVIWPHVACTLSDICMGR